MTLGRISRGISLRPWQIIHRSTVVGEASRIRQHAVAQGWQITRRRTFTFSAECLKRVNVTVPPMAEPINEGTLASFSSDIGDSVEADEGIATVETDKIDVPINSPEAGVVVEYLVEESSKVSVGQTVAVIETQDGDLQEQTQVKDEPTELKSSFTTSVKPVENAKLSANASAPNSHGERVVSIAIHFKMIEFFLLRIANV